MATKKTRMSKQERKQHIEYAQSVLSGAGIVATVEKISGKNKERSAESLLIQNPTRIKAAVALLNKEGFSVASSTKAVKIYYVARITKQDLKAESASANAKRESDGRVVGSARPKTEKPKKRHGSATAPAMRSGGGRPMARSSR